MFLIMKRDVLTHYRTVLITLAAVGGFAIFASTVSMFNRGQGEFHLIYYFILLYIGGFIFTSRAFREMYDAQKSYTYVTLPGSPPEKFIERWFFTSVGYVIGSFAAYSVIVLISEGINRALFGYSHGFLNPAQRTFLFGAAVYLVLQGIFFAGAVYFRNHPLIKTLLMIVVTAILLLVMAIIAIRFISPGYFKFTHRTGGEFNSLRDLAAWLGLSEEGLKLLGRTLWIIIRVLFWAVLAPCCWIFSYLKFRKVEV
jgi:hypothetical protein